MKKLKCLLAAMAIAFGMAVPAANAAGPLKFGVKVGTEINSLKFNEDAFKSDNRAGFTGGLMVQFLAPIINLGFDASVMYTHRSLNMHMANDKTVSQHIGSDFIEVPINLKYNIGLPVIGKFVSPFLTTGPDFSFLVSKRTVSDMKQKNYDLAWNFGIGLSFVDKVQVAASYGLGITNNASATNNSEALYDSKNRFWTVTLAYLF
ncbi:MAG: porin family protein [Muribaculaceae bacterium]|nr:porin family protein [Muribaculaceae bacterium]